MNIYEALKADHRKLEGLLDQLVKSSNDKTDTWKHTLTEIRDTLIPHARAEEAIFYNTIREVDPKNDVIRHSFAEHLAAEGELRALQGMKLVDMNFTKLAEKFRDDILHHATEEEGKVFEMAQKLFTPEEADKIGDGFEKLKAKIEDQGALRQTIELVANLLPPRLVAPFRKSFLEQEKKTA